MASGGSDRGRPGAAASPLVGAFLLLVALAGATPGLGAQEGPTPGSALDQGRASVVGLADGLGHLLSAGGPLPAQPGTAGLRVPGSPRWTVDAGVAAGSFRWTDVSGSSPRTVRSTVVAPRVAVAGGLFEGFAPAPTVAGIGAVDLVVEGRLLSMPLPDGVERRTVGWGAGARVGILRESFTLPSVTLTGMYRGAGTLRHGDAREGTARVAVAPRVGTMRASVGKDLLAVGVSGGVERSWHRGRARVQARPPAAPPGPDSELETFRPAAGPDRTTWFVGLNRTWVVARMAAEVGYSPAPDFGELPEAAARPGSLLTFALGFRVTY
ncbi:MAG: hypothetical protein EA352_04695 [Gemmatimonadales bacterium]|nr:MAG: hypothetical protein EA352_04695 [Gemmatimonadales bacterium]